jgi:ligand-binding sensor domain-containing protein
MITPDSLLLFGTENGLSVFDGFVWKNYTINSGLAGNEISDIKIDHNAQGYSVWLTSGDGITLLGSVSIDTIDILDQFKKNNSGLICDTVHAMTLDNNAVKWFGTKKGVSVLSENEWISISTANYLLSNFIEDLTCDKSGLVHIATKGGGVSRLRIDEVDAITSASTIVSTWSWLLNDTIHTVFIDDSNAQWFGTGEGLFRHTGIDSKINWDVYQNSDGLADNYVQSITQDSAGFLWIGTKAGISKFKDGTFINYTVQDGLINDNVNDVNIDIEGNIWFATDGGVSKLIQNSTDITETSITVENFSFNNYPNPFNGGTILRFTLPEASEIEVKIYNISGIEVKRYKRKIFTRGNHKLYWDANNNDGNQLSSGVYIAAIRYLNRIISRKMIILK